MPDLRHLASQFAQTLQRLLNTSVCDGITVTAYVYSRRPGLVLLGHGLDNYTLETQPFRVGTGQGKPHCWLDLSYRACLDPENEYLTVVSSFIGIYAADEARSPLCHIDYERDKPHGYPEAHIQVYGHSPALEAWGIHAEGRSLDKLHFPVGGRRYRPALEDVIEFLIAERLAEGRPGWKQVLDQSRDEFRRLQLKAAIRRDPDTALAALRTLGHI